MAWIGHAPSPETTKDTSGLDPGTTRAVLSPYCPGLATVTANLARLGKAAS